MATERIGFASQLQDGTWGPIASSDALAQRWARENRALVKRDRVALPVLVDLPDTPPRPSVLVASGERIRWQPARGVYVVAGADVPSVVALVRLLPALTDAELDAVQALPADTQAWVTAGGRD